ncbi:MAG TPA: hypothetical protein VE962_03865 [Actinomycetota bacterium]|nr:hypothetical protein [Actinomycetota bacterium]
MSERTHGPEQALPHRGRLVATYERPEDARRAMEAARRAGFQPQPGRDVDRRGALRGEMADELESTVAGPGNVGPFTKSMSKGLARWVPLGALLGAIGGALLGFLPWPGGLDLGLRLVLGAVIGAFAGATAGFTAGGFVRPEGRHEDIRPLEAEAGTIVAIPVSGPAEAGRARSLLEGTGPTRIDETDTAGFPTGASDPERTRPVRGE